jgi:hypothetical protein
VARWHAGTGKAVLPGFLAKLNYLGFGAVGPQQGVVEGSGEVRRGHGAKVRRGPGLTLLPASA